MIDLCLYNKTYAVGALMGGLEGLRPSRTFLFCTSRRRSRRLVQKMDKLGEAKPPQTPPPRKSCLQKIVDLRNQIK
jgi:hypothetical protein